MEENVYCLVQTFNGEDIEISLYKTYDKALDELRKSIGGLIIDLISDLQSNSQELEKTMSLITGKNDECGDIWVKIGDWEFYIEENIIE